MPAYDPSERSSTQLFADLFEQCTSLLQTEIGLARSEVSENVAAAAIGLGLLAAGVILLIPGVVILLEAAVTGLNATGLAPYWSALIVGGATLLVAAILTWIGIGRLKSNDFVPRRTVGQFRRDAALARMEARRTAHVGEQRAA